MAFQPFNPATFDRFVILRHLMPEESARSSHLDFLFEQADHLTCWAVSLDCLWPPSIKAISTADTNSASTDLAFLNGIDSVPADRLPDHRKRYLTYEGPISGNRGTVSQQAVGTFRIVASECDRWDVVIHPKLATIAAPDSATEPVTMPEKWALSFWLSDTSRWQFSSRRL